MVYCSQSIVFLKTLVAEPATGGVTLTAKANIPKGALGAYIYNKLKRDMKNEKTFGHYPYLFDGFFLRAGMR